MHIRNVRMLFFSLVLMCVSAAAVAQISVSVSFGPPALPVYEQPACPGDGYIWTPGYWAYDEGVSDYYWVPGTWVEPPEVGYLWTPGYWGWGGNSFVFYQGYWGPQVGFYGGINYGFGYFGNGYEGGRWDNGRFFYNRSVTNVNVTNIHNVYNTTVTNVTVNRVSYNGGNGGIGARPTPEQEAAAHDRHIAPVAAQTQHMQEARSNPQQRASMNEGKPPVAATPKPGDFKDHVVKANEAGAPYTHPANPSANQAVENGSASRPNDNAARSGPPVHVRDLPPAERPAAPNTGNSKTDQKYQQQQDKQFAKQEQERQKLQQQQDKEDQRLAKQNVNQAKQQQTEQHHQQQTAHLQQKHEQQQQQMQQKMPPPAQKSEGKPPK